MTQLALRNPLAVLMACIALVVFAGVVAPRLAVDTFPELSPPVLVVGTQAPGMGPVDVEKTLTWRLEKYVSATPGVDRVQSVSRAGLSIIYVWLKWGTDLNSAQSLVQQQVAFAMSSVPKSLGVIPPFVLQYDPSNAPVIQVAVYGGGLSGPQLYDYAANVIEPIIEGIPGVASASPNGGRERQINVMVDPRRAAARGITSADVAAAVGKANALLPSGRFLAERFDANVYTDAVPPRVEEIGLAPVRIVDERAVLIRDVARVEDSGSPDTQHVSVNGAPAVYLNVLRVPGGNVLEIVEGVKARLSALADLPPGLTVTPIFDASTFVRGSFHGLQRELLQAFILVGLVILLFLQSPRSVLIAGIAVPISFACILIVLAVTGQTLNAFTLGGLTLSLGPLVDISVVVLESIHRRRQAGEGPFLAALHGARAVAGPALAATLSTVAVLLPVVLLSGLAKKLFMPLAITVASGMAAGYLVSMLVTPVACRYLLGHATPSGWSVWLERRVHSLGAAYVRTLERVLQHRGVLIAAVSAIVLGSIFTATRLPMSFFPEIDESMERVYVRFSPGTSLKDAAHQVDEMGKRVMERLPQGAATLVLANVGSPNKARAAMNSPNAGPHMGFLRLALAPPDARKLSQRDLADRLRQLLMQEYPGVELLQAPGGLATAIFNEGYLAPLVVEVRGENLEKLARESRAVAEVARTVPGIRDVFPTLETDYPELRIKTDRLRAGMVGVSARDAAQATLEATLGNINTPSVWVDGNNGQSYYVVTSYDGARVPDRAALETIPVRATDRAVVTLAGSGVVERGVGAVAVERNRLARSALVYMQTERRDLGTAAAELEHRLATDHRTRGVEAGFVGQVRLMRETFGGLGGAIGLAVMVVFMVMTVQFRSLRLPLVMLLTLPGALLGIVAALLAARQGFSIPALMGALMVIGIAVSNGILLVDQANREHGGGASKGEAVLRAARTRFVPIAMTSLATIAGLLPTALGLEAGTEANRPLALAVVGGLATSTLLSLFLVPAMFTLIAGARAPSDAEAA